ncbi:MAG: hypothetical protein N2V77_01245, partial [Canidatus Methanoxibalbensis ujae]|nr:hypothetical protein [Candidatus Methanoxibalbensis ujae]
MKDEEECDRMLRCYEDNKYYFVLEKGRAYYSFFYEIDNVDEVFDVEEVWEWDIENQKWFRPSKIKCGKGYLIRAPERVEKSVSVSEDCYPSVNDLIAVYNSLSPGQWACIGACAAELDISGTVLEGKVMNEAGLNVT